MIEWRDEGVILSSRPHGESSAIVEVFTATRGRHAGVMRGGGSRKAAHLLQPGTQVAAVWRARLGEHIGAFTLEPVAARAAGVMQDRAALAALGSVCALLAWCLPERDPSPVLYARTLQVLDALQGHWPALYLRWERALLEDMGFGMDLTRCAVTGATEGLAHVSPKSGMAVSVAGAGHWAPRLLPLPGVLIDGPGTAAEVAEGLRTTGHFLEVWLAAALERPVPQARARLLAALR